LAVKIRLTRMGKKKKPFYRIVAVDSRTRRDGRYLDRIGHYNPMVDPPEVQIDTEKALDWLLKGAIPTDTVKSLFRRQGIMLRFHLIKSGFDEARIQEELKKWEVLQLERQKRLEAIRAQKEREKRAQAEEAKPAEAAAEEAPAPEEAAEASAEETQEATSGEAEQEATAEDEAPEEKE